MTEVVPESWHIPRALSDETLRLITELPMDEIERRLRMEPATVEGQPSDEKLLCIAAEAIDGYGDAGIKPGEYESSTECAVEAYGSELCAFARAVLARWGSQTVLVPAEGEVAKLVKTLKVIAFWRRHVDIRQANRLDRAAVLLEQLSASRALRPIPVSERLPGPEDCDLLGHCWWGDAGCDEFVPSWRLCERPNNVRFAHWLPANALPLPESP